MKCLIGKICKLSIGDLWMGDGLQRGRKVYLVQCHCVGARTLYVPDTAVCELMLVDLHFPKDQLDFTKDFSHYGSVSRKLEIIDMLAHDACENTVVVSHT